MNCNHFTSYLCEKLTGRAAPSWINRAATIGVALPCVVPREWIDAPDHGHYSHPTHLNIRAHIPQIQHMESFSTRTLQMKDRLCYEAVKAGNMTYLKGMPKVGTARWVAYLVVALETVVTAKEGIQGTRPEIMHPGWSKSRIRILVVGPYRWRRELLCPGG